MGGGEVLNYLLKRNPAITAAIATGPLLRLAFEPPAFKVFLAKMMVNIYPAFTEKAEVDSAGVSRDPEEVKKYDADPYNHGKITAGMFFGFFNAGQWALAHAAELKTPLLIMHGTADRLTSYEGTKEFAAKAPKDLVTLKLWDGYFHELHNEPAAERTAFFAYLVNWLNNKVQG
jgi:alpha-beta hydrolase superfamily lysophospholipase